LALVDEEAKMLKTFAYATLFSTVLAGSSGLREDNPAVPKNQPAQAQPAAVDTRAPGIDFVMMQEKGQWRAPKLIGVGVYGPDDKQLGKIDDILMDHNGAAQAVVIGIGGFLGFGKKDIAIPFSALQWKTEPRKVAENPPTSTVPSTNGQPVGPPPMRETDPAVTEATQGYPDEAILNVTLAQLKAAPDFRYAASALAESETRPAGGGDAMKKTTP
jgi:sporulation protein YlmC with PRC-barrel domain